MHPLNNPEFHNVVEIKTRPGLRINPRMTDFWALTEEKKTMEEKNEVPGQTQEEAEKIIARQQPAYAIGSTLAVGTVRGNKIKPNTKALEKIIKRQEKRIEELARKNGNLECVVTSYEPFHNRLLAATNSKGLSEAVAVAERALSEHMKTNKKN